MEIVVCTQIHTFTRFLVYSRSTRPRKSVCQRTRPPVLSKYPIYASADASYRDNGCILPRGCCAAPPSVPNGYVSRHISVERITFIFVCFSLLLCLPLSLSLTHTLTLTYSLFSTPYPLFTPLNHGVHSIQWRSRNASPPISFGRCGVLHIARLGAITLFVFTSLSSYISSSGPFSIVLS